MTETPTLPAPSSQPHPIAKARAPLELTGGLVVLGAWVLEVAFFIEALDETDGVGDFFEAVGVWQLFVLPMVLIGLLVSVAPRLFFRWSQTQRSTGIGVIALLSLALGMVATVFSGGTFVTELSRASDEYSYVGVSDWLGALGLTIVSFATVVFASTALRLLLTTIERPTLEPLD